MELRSRIEEAIEGIRKFTDMEPGIGIILGTGLGNLGEKIEERIEIPYGEIPHFPVSTVKGHKGQLIFGKLSGKEVVAMQGRLHYYEGYTMEQLTFAVRVMKFLGVHTLIESNACGGLNPLFRPGDLMIITDHINFFPENPLRGKNDDSLGPRFPDMYNCYDRELVELTEDTAIELGIRVRRGVYIGVPGPNLETAAEYRMMRILGADAVGMSTVPEVIVARHMGMKVLGISVVTDMGLPDALEPMSHEKILAIAEESEPKLSKLVSRIIEKL